MTRPQPVGFLDSARAGRNAWWRYLLGLGLIAVCWQGLGAAVAALFVGASVAAGSAHSDELAALTTDNALVNFTANALTFPFVWLGVFIAIRALHRRPFRSLVAGAHPVRWGRLGYGALVWVAILLALTAVDYLQHPDLYRLTFTPSLWLVALPVVLLLTPIQTTAEELVFRGYLLQATGLLTRQPVLLVVPSSLGFALLHAANPEFLANPLLGWLPYFALGVLLAAATVRDDGAELAIGVHLANNLYNFLGVAAAGGTLVTAPVVTRLTFDPVRSVVEALVAAVLFWLVVFALHRRVQGAAAAEPAAAPGTGDGALGAGR